MSETSDDVAALFDKVAEKATGTYVEGILSAKELKKQMRQAWEERGKDGEQPTLGTLMRIAQRSCSHALYAACHSKEQEVYECAFANMQRFLKRFLFWSKYAPRLREDDNALDEVVQETLADLHGAFASDPPGGPDDPSAFIKWAQVAVLHQGQTYIKKCLSYGRRYHSIEMQQEENGEQFVDERNADPQDSLVAQELQQIVKDAILSLSNRRYQEVLWYTFLEPMDEDDLALRLVARIQDIYMWRFRAIRKLRKEPKILQVLEEWRE